MTPIFNICNVKGNGIRITDLTQQDAQYVPENTDQTILNTYYKNNRFKYSETYTINIIEYVSTTKRSILTTLYTDHCGYLDEVYYQVPKDGYYTIYHILLPSIEWLKEQLQKEDNILKDTQIYVTDGTSIYKLSENKLVVVDPELVSQINTEGTTISRSTFDTFYIGYLFKCYVSLCKKIFEGMNIKCLNNNSDLFEAIYNRDFLWMTINVIKYHTEFGDLLEAQRLLETINSCNGLCNQNVTIKSNGCGCTS